MFVYCNVLTKYCLPITRSHLNICHSGRRSRVYNLLYRFWTRLWLARM